MVDVSELREDENSREIDCGNPECDGGIVAVGDVYEEHIEVELTETGRGVVESNWYCSTACAADALNAL